MLSGRIIISRRWCINEIKAKSSVKFCKWWASDTVIFFGFSTLPNENCVFMREMCAGRKSAALRLLFSSRMITRRNNNQYHETNKSHQSFPPSCFACAIFPVCFPFTFYLFFTSKTVLRGFHLQSARGMSVRFAGEQLILGDGSWVEAGETFEGKYDSHIV